MRKQRTRIRRRRRNFDLRLTLGRRRIGVFRPQCPARSKENDEQHGKKTNHQFRSGIAARAARSRSAHTRDSRHLRLKALRWGLVGHRLRSDSILKLQRVDNRPSLQDSHVYPPLVGVPIILLNSNLTTYGPRDASPEVYRDPHGTFYSSIGSPDPVCRSATNFNVKHSAAHSSPEIAQRPQWRRVAGPQPGAAPFGFEGAVFDFPSSMLSASPSALCLFNVVNPNQPFLSLRVVRPTAPRPVFRMNGQFSFYGIRVHVLQLLPQLLRAPHIEIVEPALPKRRCIRCHPRKRQQQLPRHRLLPSAA